jgi:uncharacterized short protein YbdD (DUF466 family)
VDPWGCNFSGTHAIEILEDVCENCDRLAGLQILTWDASLRQAVWFGEFEGVRVGDPVKVWIESLLDTICASLNENYLDSIVESAEEELIETKGGSCSVMRSLEDYRDEILTHLKQKNPREAHMAALELQEYCQSSLLVEESMRLVDVAVEDLENLRRFVRAFDVDTWRRRTPGLSME